MRRCCRCGEDTECSKWDAVALCGPCLRLIVLEWWQRREDFAELTKS